MEEAIITQELHVSGADKQVGLSSCRNTSEQNLAEDAA